MAKCMAAALLNCQQFKRAKAAKGQGKKRVKLTPEEKLRRLIPRQAAAMARRTAKVRAYEDARDARRAAKGPIKNPGKYRKDKGFWTKDAKAERKAKWEGDTANRAARKQKIIDSYNKPENVAKRAALKAQNQRLDAVAAATSG